MTAEHLPFREFLTPNQRPYLLAADEDANLVGMRLYGEGPFHREFKLAINIQKKSHFVIRSGDVIYNKLFAWKGTFGIVPPEFDGMFVSDKFPTYSLNADKVDPGYLRWYFRAPGVWEQAKALSTGSAAISKLTLNPPLFLNLTAPVPPLSEQRRIVAKIDQLASKIEEAKGLLGASSAEAKLLLKSYLHQLTSTISGLRPLGETLSEKPRNGWSSRCDNADGGVPILTLSAVTGYRYDGTAFKRMSFPTDPDAHYWLQPGDLLMTRSNTPDLVGHAALYDGTPARCIYPDLMMRVPVDESKACKRFVWYWLQSPIVRDYIQANAKGTSPTMKKIAQGTVMGIPFPATLPLPEQHRIVAYLDDLQAKVDQLKTLQAQTAAELDALLPSILDRAFRGEL